MSANHDLRLCLNLYYNRFDRGHIALRHALRYPSDLKRKLDIHFEQGCGHV